MSAYTCSRCGGSGRYSFNLMHGSKCYGCAGTGMQRTKPRKPTPKWAVFGQHRATGQWLRLYNVTARTEPEAIRVARATMDKASSDWRNTYSLARARALKWADMASLDALSWDEATTKEAA